MVAISIDQMYVMAKVNGGSEAQLAQVDFASQTVTLIETFYIIDHNNVAAAVLDSTGTGGYFSGTSNYLRSYGCDQYLNIFPANDYWGSGSSFTFGFVQTVDHSNSCSHDAPFTSTVVTPNQKNQKLDNTNFIVSTS